MPAVSIKELWVRLCAFLPDGGSGLCDRERPAIVLADVGDGIRRALTCDEDVEELVRRRGGAGGFVEVEVRPLFPGEGAGPRILTLPVVALCRPGGQPDAPLPPGSPLPTRPQRPKSAGASATPPRPAAGGGAARFRRYRPAAAAEAPAAGDAAAPAPAAVVAAPPEPAPQLASPGPPPPTRRSAPTEASAPSSPQACAAPSAEAAGEMADLAERIRALPESALLLPQAARVRPGVRMGGPRPPSPPTTLRNLSPPGSAEASPCARRRLSEAAALRRALRPDAVEAAIACAQGHRGEMHDEAWQHRAGELSAHLMDAVGLREQYENLRYESSRRRVALEWLLRTRDTVPGPYSLHFRPRSESSQHCALASCFDSVADAPTAEGGQVAWEQGDFWPVRSKDVPKVKEAIEKLHLMEGTAAVRLQDEAVSASWRMKNARRRMAEVQPSHIGGILLTPRRVLLESRWLGFGEAGKVAFRIYPAGDATAQPGNATVFIWMEKPPGLSFTFNLRVGEILITAPRLWQATMIHYRMDLRWSQLSSALATGDGAADELCVVLQVLQWHGPEGNPADSVEEQQTSVSLALELLQGAASASMAALAEHGALRSDRARALPGAPALLPAEVAMVA